MQGPTVKDTRTRWPALRDPMGVRAWEPEMPSLPRRDRASNSGTENLSDKKAAAEIWRGRVSAWCCATKPKLTPGDTLREPATGWSAPCSRPRSVLLPAPLGPTRATFALAVSCAVTPDKTQGGASVKPAATSSSCTSGSNCPPRLRGGSGWGNSIGGWRTRTASWIFAGKRNPFSSSVAIACIL